MHQIDPAVVDPEIRGEREFMELCRAQLISMRDEVAAMLANRAAEGDGVGDKYFNQGLREFRKKVIESLSGFDDAPLFFGRMDYAPGGVYDHRAGSGARLVHTRRADRDLVYVGRRGVRDDNGEPVVIDWRASLARAFYEASAQDAMGVRPTLRLRPRRGAHRVRGRAARCRTPVRVRRWAAGTGDRTPPSRTDA